MALRYPQILGLTSTGTSASWSDHDTILYALGVGMGDEPGDLPFVIERGLRALPTMAAVIGSRLGISVAALGIDRLGLLHAEQGIVWHRPLKASGTLSGDASVAAVYDRGDKGTLVVLETRLHDAGEPVATITTTLLARRDRNSGASAGTAPAPRQMPARSADRTVIVRVPTNLALLYRLSGDLNALHADPLAARAAGFDRPILHGLCTYGIVGRVILRACCDDDPARLASLSARFSSPVFPGDVLTIDLWHDRGIAFEAKISARGVTVLKGGDAQLR